MQNNKDHVNNVSISLCDHRVPLHPRGVLKKSNEQCDLTVEIKIFIKKLHSLFAEYQTWYKNKSTRFFAVLHSVKCVCGGLLGTDIATMEQYRMTIEKTRNLRQIGQIGNIDLNILDEFLQKWTSLQRLIEEFKDSLVVKVSESFGLCRRVENPEYYSEFVHLSEFIIKISKENWPFSRIKRFDNEHLFTFAMSTSTNDSEGGLVHMIPYILGFMVKICNLVNKIRIEKV